MIRHFSSGNWLTGCRKENFLFEFFFSWPLKEKYSWKLLFNQSTLPLYYISGYQIEQIHLKIINVKLFLKFDFLACEHFLLLKQPPHYSFFSIWSAPNLISQSPKLPKSLVNSPLLQRIEFCSTKIDCQYLVFSEKTPIQTLIKVTVLLLQFIQPSKRERSRKINDNVY